MITEKLVHPMSGWFPLLICIAMPVAAILLIVGMANQVVSPVALVLVIGLVIATIFTIIGFKAIAPNDSRTFLLFGEYKGSVKESGLLG